MNSFDTPTPCPPLLNTCCTHSDIQDVGVPAEFEHEAPAARIPNETVDTTTMLRNNFGTTTPPPPASRQPSLSQPSTVPPSTPGTRVASPLPVLDGLRCTACFSPPPHRCSPLPDRSAAEGSSTTTTSPNDDRDVLAKKKPRMFMTPLDLMEENPEEENDHEHEPYHHELLLSLEALTIASNNCVLPQAPAPTKARRKAAQLLALEKEEEATASDLISMMEGDEIQADFLCPPPPPPRRKKLNAKRKVSDDER